MGDFDCIIIKHGHQPFIYKVKSASQDFEIVDLSRMVTEAFSIQKIEETEISTGRKALYIVANKLRWDREDVVAEIHRLQPRPVKYYD
ncbi:hypothetical protein 8AX3_2 [uncultured Caudovirales phage]|uniref:Uncharacterized protein n=1 Tax=uncultured Caudovirales phage TaxID=2100421 RepID=A0A2H4J5T0_9CAUD|nr:hypothetical protein 8AX3_2 [uncultured Caudovirales phage]